MDEIIMNDKSTIRKNILVARSSLTTEQVREKSRIIVEKLLTMVEYEQSKVVMCYMDFKNEVNTGEIISRSLKDGKKVALPVMVNINGAPKIQPYLVSNLETDLVLSGFGIMEPDTNKLEVAPLADIDLVVMPGVAFGTNKQRIGYGKGYYDRFLPQLNANVPKIAIAFDVQVVDKIDPGRYDIPMDRIITESRII